MSKYAHLQLKILVPSAIFLDEKEVTHLVVETTEGSYGVRPNRQDLVAILEPGILVYEKSDSTPLYVAHDTGVMVKTGGEVLISTRKAFKEKELGKIKTVLHEEMATLEKKEEHLREIITDLERDISSHILHM